MQRERNRGRAKREPGQDHTQQPTKGSGLVVPAPAAAAAEPPTAARKKRAPAPRGAPPGQPTDKHTEAGPRGGPGAPRPPAREQAAPGGAEPTPQARPPTATRAGWRRAIRARIGANCNPPPFRLSFAAPRVAEQAANKFGGRAGQNGPGLCRGRLPPCPPNRVRRAPGQGPPERERPTVRFAAPPPPRSAQRSAVPARPAWIEPARPGFQSVPGHLSRPNTSHAAIHVRKR